MDKKESKFVAREKEILKFWQDNKIFEKSVDKKSPKGDYVFYDGPPFATGTPHYGHLVASIMKDVVPRYWTMNGYKVERRWGWDCHGLPIENLVEKELGFKSKQEIEEFGIDKFNETCRSKVLGFADEWKKTINRLGRWADMENPYSTMDLEYMESVWWVFKQLWDNGLIYKDYKSMHICPRCETTLSQQEVSEGYKDVKDISVIAKFELVDEPGTFVLAWTTTPWTLPGNVALAMGGDIEYVKVESEEQNYILAKANLEKIFTNKEYKELGKISAKDLEGKNYKPLFNYFENSNLENKENIYTIQLADFVTVEDGTGVVHIAPAFGEDDMNLGREKKLPFVQHVGSNGKFTATVTDFAGKSVKPAEDPSSADIEIIKYLAGKNLLFAKEKYEHSYPHCWRCDTPLLNYATSSWFVKVTQVKDDAIKYARDINWSPAHIKEGRFGKWLEGARDWSISRQRFWASVMPVWQDDKTGEYVVVGSVAELEKLSGQKVNDLHKHIVDKITWTNEKTGGTMSRISDVLDTWFDSGSMPYAQMHYPFENEKKFLQNFPAEFIAEGVDQTRAWFYYLHVISAGIMKKPAFKNVIVNGIVLAGDGKKMSKKLQNYPDPNEVLESYGADALRFYLLSAPVMEAENLNFVESGVKESLQKVVMLLDNVLSFYQMYSDQKDVKFKKSDNVLDQWIVAKLHELIKTVTENMNDYSLVKSVRPIQEFINELSTWYVRRSRDRFKDGDKMAVQTLGYVLQELSKVMAPFTPFMADYLYKQLSDKNSSVHLETWPEFDKKLIKQDLSDEMKLARQIVEKGLAARMENKMKVRQPLASYSTSLVKELDKDIIEIVKEELNIKELKFGQEKLDVELTEELKLEGLFRDMVRQINQMRKEEGLTIEDRINIYYQGLSEFFDKYSDDLKQATLSNEVIEASTEKMVEVEGGKVGIKKV